MSLRSRSQDMLLTLARRVVATRTVARVLAWLRALAASRSGQRARQLAVRAHRSWRRARARLRLAHQRLRRDPGFGPGYVAADRCVGFALSETRRVSGLAAGSLRRFWAAHLDAWSWLGEHLARPWRRKAAPAAPVPEPVPNCIFSCIVCAHEAMLVGAKKYQPYRCPECRSRLLIIDLARGMTFVAPEQYSSSDLEVPAKKVEKQKTETSLPILMGPRSPVPAA
jgi:hypothetical protein